MRNREEEGSNAIRENSSSPGMCGWVSPVARSGCATAELCIDLVSYDTRDTRDTRDGEPVQCMRVGRLPRSGDGRQENN